MTIGERIKQIRKANKKNLDEFGKMINVTGPMVSMMENGKAAVIDRTIKAICREFDVSEEWLRDGTGPMMKEKSRDEQLTEAIDRILSGENPNFKQRLVTVLSTLNEKQWAFLEDKLLEIVGQKEESAPEEEADDFPEDIDAEVEAYRQELLAEKRMREELAKDAAKNPTSVSANSGEKSA